MTKKWESMHLKIQNQNTGKKHHNFQAEKWKGKSQKKSEAV